MAHFAGSGVFSGGGGTNTPTSSSEFWTACPSCCYVHSYERGYEGRLLRCPTSSCGRAFLAAKVAAPPPVVPGTNMYFCAWGFFPLGYPSSPVSGDWVPFVPFPPPWAPQPPPDSGGAGPSSPNKGGCGGLGFKGMRAPPPPPPESGDVGPTSGVKVGVALKKRAFEPEVGICGGGAGGGQGVRLECSPPPPEPGRAGLTSRRKVGVSLKRQAFEPEVEDCAGGGGGEDAGLGFKGININEEAVELGEGGGIDLVGGGDDGLGFHIDLDSVPDDGNDVLSGLRFVRDDEIAASQMPMP